MAHGTLYIQISAHSTLKSCWVPPGTHKWVTLKWLMWGSVLVLSRIKKTQISSVMEREQEKVDQLLICFFSQYALLFQHLSGFYVLKCPHSLELGQPQEGWLRRSQRHHILLKVCSFKVVSYVGLRCYWVSGKTRKKEKKTNCRFLTHTVHLSFDILQIQRFNILFLNKLWPSEERGSSGPKTQFQVGAQ